MPNKKTFLYLTDLCLVFSAYLFSYFICMESKHFDLYFPLFYQTVLFWLISKSVVFYLAGFYLPLWRYASISAVLLVLKGTLIASCIVVIVLFFSGLRLPRSILIVDWMLTFLLVGGSRLLIRIFKNVALLDLISLRIGNAKKGIRVLILGAGDTGELILRQLIDRPQDRQYSPVGFIDDFKHRGQRIHDVPILGTCDVLPEIIRDENIEELIIAIPSLDSQKLRKIVDKCRTLGTRFKVAPRIRDIAGGDVDPDSLRNLNIGDLLKRNPQHINYSGIQKLLGGARVLVTGAGGSIGRELCLQVAACHPQELILLEKSENNLYSVKTSLEDKFPALRVHAYLLDVTHSRLVNAVFEERRPEIVFHVAAHKHVPLCEENICEAVVNNVGGTVRVVNAAHQYATKKFIFISTDKAVKPSGVMGATKKIGEQYVQGMNQRSRTAFITVRFGNVLESSGNVIMRFREQICKGGPVTVTHPDVTRYFMLLSEAAQLILHGASMGRGGEIFVLDMGSPIRIVDLVRDLIALLETRPDREIKIEFSSLRAGEKLHEELYDDPNRIVRADSSILIAHPIPVDFDVLNKNIELLLGAAEERDRGDTYKWLGQLLPQFPLAEKGLPLVSSEGIHENLAPGF